MSGHIDKIINDRYPKTMQMNLIEGELSIIARAMRNTLILNDEQQIKKELGRIDG